MGVCLAASAYAEAEADPAYLTYGYGLGHYGYAGHPYAGYAVSPYYRSAVTYAHAPRYYANSGGAVHIVKREAEAKAEADPWTVYGYGYPSAYRYGYAAAPYYRAYAHPYAYGYPAYGYSRYYGGYARGYYGGYYGRGYYGW